jgi:hypothetical protein
MPAGDEVSTESFVVGRQQRLTRHPPREAA